MLSRIWIANFLLVLFAIFLTIKACEIWSNGEKGNPRNPIAKKPIAYPERIITKREIPPATDYEVVVQKNLFWPDRLESEPQKPGQKTKAEPKTDGGRLRTLEKIIKLTNLYGVIIVDDRKEALISQVPFGRRGISKGGGVKRTKVGDTVGRFKVKEIKDTSVLLTAGGHEWRISLFDKDKPKKRVPVRKETGPIVVGAGSKPEIGRPSQEAKAKEKPPVPVISKKKMVDKDPNKRKALPVPKRLTPEKR